MGVVGDCQPVQTKDNHHIGSSGGKGHGGRWEDCHPVQTKDTHHIGSPGWEVHGLGGEWVGMHMENERSRNLSFTGIKSFFFRRMTSPTWISFHLMILNLKIKNNNDLEMYVLIPNDKWGILATLCPNSGNIRGPSVGISE